MILTLIRRDQTLRRLPIWALLLILNVTVLLGLLRFNAVKGQSTISQASLLVIGWATVAVYLLLGHGRTRAGAFQLGLPIPAPRLWLAHLAAGILGGLLIMAAFIAVAAAQAVVLGGRVSLDANFGALASLLGAATVLAAILLQAPRPSMASLPLSAGYAAWAALVLLALLVLLPSLAPRALAATSAMLALAAAAGIFAYRSVPPAFALVPRNTAAGASSAPATADAAVGRAGAGYGASGVRGNPWLLCMRSLSIGPKEIPLYLFTVIVGLFLGGAQSAWSHGSDIRDLRFIYIPMGTYILFTVLAPKLSPLHHLDPLPIPRRRIFALMILPTAAVFVACFAAGQAVSSLFAPRTEYVDFTKQKNDGRWALTVPLRLYEISRDGRVPDVTSPWGETHPADRLPLIRGGRAAIYNPFSAPGGSSVRFVALQASRAASALYGASIPPDEVEQRWLQTLPDGTVAARGAGLAIRADHPELAPRSGPIAPLMIALVFVPWFILGAALLRGYRAGITDRWRVLTFWSVVALFVLSMLASGATLVAGFASPWLARALVEIPAWTIGPSAAGAAAAWLICLALIYGAYRLAEAQFVRMEIPTKPMKFSLLDLNREQS